VSQLNIGNLLTRQRKFKTWIWHHYYAVIFIAYFLAVFYPGMIRPGVVGTILLLIVGYSIFPIRLHSVGLLILCYFALTWIDVFLTPVAGLPVSVGLREFTNSSLPVLFYFVGSSSKFNAERAYSNYLSALLFAYFVGFIWYLSPPQYYLEYLYRVYNLGSTGYFLDPRFTSFLSSVEIAPLACVGMLISIHSYLEGGKARDLLLTYGSLLVTMLTLQRAAYLMVAAIFLAAALRYYKSRFKRVLILFLPAMFVVLFLLSNIDSSLFLNMINKLSRLGSAVAERSSQWSNVTKIGIGILWGHGLGSMSHKAIGYTDLLINDGGFFKLLGETGLIGFVLLCTGVFLALGSCFGRKCRTDIFIERMTIIIFAIDAVGSNTLFFQVCAPVFWLALGRLALARSSNIEEGTPSRLSILA